MNRILLTLFLVGLSFSTLWAEPLQLAPSVDLPRVMGGWYIVAAIPNGFEKHLVGMYDYYSLRSDGTIREDFFPHRDSFLNKADHFTVTDTIVSGTHNALWRVHFFGPISAPFPLLYVTPDYEYVLFGFPNHQLGWIYSRTPKIDEKTYQELLQHFAQEGYDISKFRRTIQFPDQIGKPGFSSPTR